MNQGMRGYPAPRPSVSRIPMYPTRPLIGGAGKYVLLQPTNGQVGTPASIASNTWTAIPTAFSNSATLTSVGLSVSTLAAGNVRLALYYDQDEDGYPDVLCADFGQIDCSATGEKMLSCSVLLQAGPSYWLALCGTVTPLFRTSGTSLAAPPYYATAAGAANNASRYGWEATGSAPSNPAPGIFPTGGTVGGNSFNWIGTVA